MNISRWLVVLALPVVPSIRFAASAQTAPATQTAITPETAVLQALASNPATSPYRFGVAKRDGKIILSGRVATKEVHDIAVRLAMAVTPSIDDRLVIDTAEAGRAVMAGAAGAPAVGGGVAAYRGIPAGGYGPPYLYPPPLFGRYDDPFYGFEPPVISYPPWWGAVTLRKGDPYAAPVLDPYAPISPDPGPAPVRNAAPQPKAAGEAGERSAENPAVEMTLDPRGVAVLRGTVASEDIRLGIGQKVARMQGVTEVINRLEVRADAANAGVPIRGADVPPPPPTPADVPARPDARTPAPDTNRPDDAPRPGAILTPDEIPAVGNAPRAAAPDDLTRRVVQSLDKRPALKDSAVQVEVRDGVAYLSGKVDTAYEAMLAFRAAQQTVGVHSVVDRLTFTVPDGQKPNPLIARGRPEDVEPYLEAQIRRQLGDRAQVDRVRVSGDRLEVRGTITRADDRAGVEAILRSMPLLRGYDVDARFEAE